MRKKSAAHAGRGPAKKGKQSMATNNRGKTSSRPGAKGGMKTPTSASGVSPHTLGRDTPKARDMM